ncbi:MAG: hypothetical protein IPJ65_02710 [Archangiaceae bacterium]|nr:hypothetical protein [Archangiaceae bacterium]
MRLALFALTLLPLSAHAGPFRERLADALASLGEGRAALLKLAPSCRESMLGNFDLAIRDLHDVRANPSPERVKQVHFFVAGMAFTAGLGGCPTSLLTHLATAKRALTAAQGVPLERDDEVASTPRTVAERAPAARVKKQPAR